MCIRDRYLTGDVGPNCVVGLKVSDKQRHRRPNSQAEELEKKATMVKINRKRNLEEDIKNEEEVYVPIIDEFVYSKWLSLIHI